MTTNIEISCEAYQLLKPSDEYLFPALSPNREGLLQVSDVHHIWFAEYGNERGFPVICVHGGPGGGSSPRDMRYFDPRFYRVIVFDQRGAGRSTPHASTQENTTQDLIEDMEKLRLHFGVERFLVFGGSWGSALSLAYGEAYPQHCVGFILRGVFLGTKREYLKLWNNMGDIYPEAFKEYREFIPEEEREDLVRAYHRRLINPDPHIHMSAAGAFCKYDFIAATLIDKSQLTTQLADDKKVLALARLFAHYSVNDFFFDDDQLIKHLSSITHLPCIIAHGRYDVICRVSEAFRLHEHWPQSKLMIVQDAGHASFDAGMTKALVRATEEMKKKCA